MSFWHQISFQEANSSIMENMIFFYDFAMFVVIVIISYILYLFMFMIFNKILNRFILHGQMIELIWTIIPMFMLIFLAIPSLKILYLSDELIKPLVTVKAIGHQWYWEYEYNLEFVSVIFDLDIENEDSLMKKNMKKASFRLLDVSESFKLPYKLQIRLLILSEDVIHSFAVPSLGIKVDAVPGRLNQISLLMNRPGLFFGQCSEICGVNHSFMPIVIESIKYTKYMEYLIWIQKERSFMKR